MLKKILLLDCDKKLFTRLKRQGFDVEVGSLGFVNGVKKILRPVYEYDIFIYNPTSFKKEIFNGQFGPIIEDKSPEYSFYEIKQCIERGAVILAFINKITDNINNLNQVYNWIPQNSSIEDTKDYKIIPNNKCLDWTKPIIIPNEIKIPVTTKLSPNFNLDSNCENNLFYNYNMDVLGLNYSVQEGEVIILPTFKKNNDIVNIFLNRSIKKLGLFGDQKSNLIELFKSPDEIKEEEKLKKTEEEIKKQESDFGELKEKLFAATRQKENIISKDDTAKLITNYYKMATDNEDAAIFYLYKIIDAFKKKFGEKEAKNILNCNNEFNLIGTLSNKSYADARHAPYPEEKIIELTPAEIERCFIAAINIINSYFKSLF